MVARARHDVMAKMAGNDTGEEAEAREVKERLKVRRKTEDTNTTNPMTDDGQMVSNCIPSHRIAFDQ